MSFNITTSTSPSQLGGLAQLRERCLRSGVIALTMSGMLLMAACKSAYQADALTNPPDGLADGGTAGRAGSFPVTGINSGTLSITGVEPGTGPFSGGTQATIRGSGFDDTVEIHIGGVAIQPGELTRDGKNRITVVVPAGRVGPADIEIKQGDKTVTLRDGFLYNALAVDPNKGAAAGGSLVNLSVSGATLPQDAIVEFDGVACSELNITTPQSATCKTPPHAVGIVDVTARSASGNGTPLIAAQSYEFAETLDASNGGLSGGPIAGTLNVTVLADGAVGNVIPGALVMLGNDPLTAQHGFTDARGAITFSAKDLKGPVTLHATAKCFQRASIVKFDAKDVTMFLGPTLDAACSADGGSGTGVRQLASTVSGELIFPGHEEFDVNTWDIVPQPKSNEIRVAYIYTTQASLESGRVPPDGTGTEIARIVEASALKGKRGYPYRIRARPAGLAVFALAGLERTDSLTQPTFTPYVMGVAHDVVTSPGEEAVNVDITMTIPLDRELSVSLMGYPAATSDGPDEFRVRSYVDLGGEGLIIRDVNGVSLDLISRHSGADMFRFMGQPALIGGLQNASYYVLAGYYSNVPDGPYTRQKRTGVVPGSQPLLFDNFLHVPKVVAPALGSRIPDDRTLRFSLDGPDPDLIVIDVYGSDSLLAWTQVLPGDAREAPLPDLSLIEGQKDLTPGFLRWVVMAVKIDDFRYNEFKYTYLTSRYWTHDAMNLFYARR